VTRAWIDANDRSSHQLLDRYGQITYAFASRVINGIRNGRGDGHRGEFAETLRTERTCFLIELLAKEDIEMRDVGITRDQVAG
jgi:hypothetical protein